LITIGPTNGFANDELLAQTQVEGEGILRTRREVHVQDEQKKMREIRKAIG
jgi:hypothetical protein